MKKLIITIAIIFGLGLTTFADPNGGGLFMRGETMETRDGSGMPGLPGHGQNTNQPAPLGTGIALLAFLSTGYLINKRGKKE